VSRLGGLDGIAPTHRRRDHRFMIIFDFDGVIVDSERLANAVLARMVSALGRPMDAAEAARRFTGKVTRDCLTLIEHELGLAVPPGFAADYEDAITDAYQRDLTPVVGIVPVLESLRGPRCIASGSSHPRIAHALRLVGLGHHFEGAVFSAEEVARGKPAPDVFLHAAARMGVDPDGCVVVEDSLTGVAGARAAGMPVFGLVGTFGADELAAAGATPVHSPAELLAQPLFRRRAGIGG
jgi:HAD superfamily hydrolase (TIGR01509 family)